MERNSSKDQTGLHQNLNITHHSLHKNYHKICLLAQAKATKRLPLLNIEADMEEISSKQYHSVNDIASIKRETG